MILVQHDESILASYWSNSIQVVCAQYSRQHVLQILQQWFGVLRKPEQTIKATLNVKHPMDLQIPLPDILLRAVATVLMLGPGAVDERRASHCSRIVKRIKELETEEEALHETLHVQVFGLEWQATLDLVRAYGGDGMSRS